MMLMVGPHEDVGTVERLAVHGIVIGERSPRRQHVPRVVDVVVNQPEAQREMHAHGNATDHMLRDELALREHGMMLRQFLGSVGRFVRVDDSADLADGDEVGRLHQPNRIVGERHDKNPL